MSYTVAELLGRAIMANPAGQYRSVLIAMAWRAAHVPVVE